MGDKYNPQLDPESLMTTNTTAALYNLSAHTLRTWRARGRGPKYIRISKNCVLYRRRDVLADIRAMEVQT